MERAARMPCAEGVTFARYTRVPTRRTEMRASTGLRAGFTSRYCTVQTDRQTTSPALGLGVGVGVGVGQGWAGLREGGDEQRRGGRLSHPMTDLDRLSPELELPGRQRLHLTTTR